MSAARSQLVHVPSSMIPSTGSFILGHRDPVQCYGTGTCGAETAKLIARVTQKNSVEVEAPSPLLGLSVVTAKETPHPQPQGSLGDIEGVTGLLSLCLRCFINPAHSRRVVGGSKPPLPSLWLEGDIP